jgi:hypothetical protein
VIETFVVWGITMKIALIVFLHNLIDVLHSLWILAITAYISFIIQSITFTCSLKGSNFIACLWHMQIASITTLVLWSHY